MNLRGALCALAGMATAIGTATAQNVTLPEDPQPVFQEDVPVNGYVTMRNAVTPIADEIHQFHNWVILPIMVGISVFVLGLLIWVAFRYNSKAHPIPKKFSHNTLVEVVWTLVPVLILIYIALFSFSLLYLEDRMPDAAVYEYEAGAQLIEFPNDFAQSRRVTEARHLELALIDQVTGEERTLGSDDYDVEGLGLDSIVVALAEPVPANSRLVVTGGRSRVGKGPFLGIFGQDYSQIVPAPTLTIKATGFQWGWTYNYPDFGDFEFDSLMASRDAVPSNLFRLATTNDVVVPAGETVRIVTTGRDVIHSWAMPAFGVKIDAIPGRLNETWFYTEQEGTYYGQCSEICGIDHAYMPISVRVVSRPEFQAWVDEQAELNGLEPFFSTDEQLAAVTTSVSAN